MVSERTETLAITFFVLAVCTALFMRGCVPPPARMVIRSFEQHKDSFVTVAEYIESGSSAAYAANGEPCEFAFRDWTGADTVFCRAENFAVPQTSQQVKNAVRLLLYKLRYEEIERNAKSKSTWVETRIFQL